MALTFGSKLVRDQRFSPRIAESRTRLELKTGHYEHELSTFPELLVPLDQLFTAYRSLLTVLSIEWFF